MVTPVRICPVCQGEMETEEHADITTRGYLEPPRVVNTNIWYCEACGYWVEVVESTGHVLRTAFDEVD